MRRVAGLTKRVGGPAVARLNYTVARAAEQPIVPHGDGKARRVKAPIAIDPPATGDAGLEAELAPATGPGTSLCPARPRASMIAIENLPHGNHIGGFLTPAQAWGACE